MTKEKLSTLTGSFTWGFGFKFFIETEEDGNFVWSNPQYQGGTGEIRPYNGSYDRWIGDNVGRDKGEHVIGDYCSPFTFNPKAIR